VASIVHVSQLGVLTTNLFTREEVSVVLNLPAQEREREREREREAYAKNLCYEHERAR
jgi:hypothetical protein